MTKNAKNIRMNHKAIAAIEDQHKEIANALADAIEGKGFEWIQDWGIRNDGTPNVPVSGVSGNPYQGRNFLILSFYQRAFGFTDNRWCTANHAKKQGWTVNADAKGVWIEKWTRVSGHTPKKDKDGNIMTDENGKEIWRTYFYMKLVDGWCVFNYSEIDGAPKAETPEVAAPEVVADAAGEMADEFIRTFRCPVHEVMSDGAFYRPSADNITVPLRTQFNSNEGFLRTLLHEMVHATDPVLHRDIEYKGKGRALEELVAEMGAVFAAADCGFALDFSDCEGNFYAKNHVAYLQNWSQSLRDDPEYIFKAASMASAAASYINGIRTGKVDPATGRKVKTEAETPETPEVATA